MLQYLYTDMHHFRGSEAIIVDKEVISRYKIYSYFPYVDKTTFTGHYSGIKSINVTS